MARHAADRPRRRGGRWRAILAGGVVLGIGATATLAAWNDSEIAVGTFGSSVFALESQSGGSPSYANHSAPASAKLTFEAGALSPGASRYAWLNVRTTPASTVGGNVQLSGVTSEGALAPALEYRAVRMVAVSPAAVCDSTAFAAPSTFLVGSPTSWVPLSVAVPAVPTPTGAGGAAIGFCFDVRIAPGASNAFQGTTASSTWTFTGTSD